MWFKNAQDVNMRILRWRQKLAEYDYEVVYKAGKTNADALSRNPINLEEVDCKPIRDKNSLNPEDPQDARKIAELLEETDDFELHSSDTNFPPYSQEDHDDDDYKLYTLILILYRLHKN